MRDWITPSAGRPSVSLIYNKIIDCITKPLSIKTIWNRELSDLNLSVDWERVWSNLSLTSKNLSHRLIHFKVIHRAYITPYKRFKMKLQSNLNCHIQCPPLILAPLINMSKGGCENKSALFILLIFHSINSQNSNLSLK